MISRVARYQRLPDIRPAIPRQVDAVVAVHVVEFVPEVGVHDDAVDAETGVRVDVGLLQDAEFLVVVLNTPESGEALVELPELVVIDFAEIALLFQTGLVGVQDRQKTA